MRAKLHHIALACVMGASFWAASGHAQTLPIPANADPLQEQAREKQLEDRRKRLDTFQERAKAPDAPAQAAGGPCFEVDKINVLGVEVLPPKLVGALIGKYVPGCLQAADIQSLMRGLDALYADRGYITAKTYIPPQNIASGELTLEIVEGRVEGLYLVDKKGLNETGRGKAKLKTAFPTVPGEVLQLRKLEQGLDQMNRLASVEAKMRLQPGQTVGGSAIIIQRIQGDRFRGNLRLDNLGSKSIGKDQIAFDFALDDALSLNDTWSLGYSGAEKSNALSFSGSIPYGRATFTLNAGYSEYQVPLTALAELFGTTRTAGFEAKFLAHRDQSSTTDLKVALNVNKSDRYINAARLTPQNLSSLTLGTSHIVQNGPVKNSFDLGTKIGLKSFDADRDIKGISKATPHAQFVKLEGGWLRQQSMGETGTLVQDLRFQFAPHALYSAEQMSLGSYSTVRGYETAEAVGDVGFYIRTDFYLGQKLWSPQSNGAPAPFLTDWAPFVFMDNGLTYDYALKRKQVAGGFGLGANYEKGRVKGSILLAAPFMSKNKFDVGSPVLTLKLEAKLF